MAAEAGVLGTPFIRFNDFVGRIGYLADLEDKYKLGFGIKTNEEEKLYSIIKTLLNTPDLKKQWQIRRQKMLSEKIDVTAFLTWFIENYPQSVEIMKDNPDYQYNFK
jgi:predicted glycosyltransferase